MCFKNIYISAIIHNVDPCQRSAQAWSGKCVAKNDGKTTKKWALKKTYLTPSMSRLIEPYVNRVGVLDMLNHIQ